MAIQGIPQHWRRIRERYRLQGAYCQSCKTNFYPPRQICPKCRRRGKMIPVIFSGRGKVFTYTTIHAASEAFEEYTPYIVALVELEEGPRVLSQLVDCEPDRVSVGMEVEACFRKIFEQEGDGIICYGFKFRPMDSSWIQYYKGRSNDVGTQH